MEWFLGGHFKPLDRDGAEAEIPGYKNFIIYCDETGSRSDAYYGFGSLWIPWERRGTLSALIGAERRAHYDQEVKWTNTKKRTLEMHENLVEQFFRRRWMMFHALLVKREDVERERFHSGSWELAMRKHYTLLLANKLNYFAAGRSDRTYRIRVDALPYSYGKSDEAMQAVANNITNLNGGVKLVGDIAEVDSREVAGVQLCDLLLGAVAAPWQGKARSYAKRTLQTRVAEHLGWEDLNADTFSTEWKFNIWHFHDRLRVRRRAKTRKVELKYPVPPFTPAR